MGSVNQRWSPNPILYSRRISCRIRPLDIQPDLEEEEREASCILRPLTSRACPLREQTLDTLLRDAVFNIRGKYQVNSQEISKQARVVFFLSESIVRLDDSIMEQCRIRMYNEAARIFISSLNSLPPRRFILPPAFIRTTADTSDILQAIDSPSRSGTSCMVKENAILQTKRHATPISMAHIRANQASPNRQYKMAEDSLPLWRGSEGDAP